MKNFNLHLYGVTDSRLSAVIPIEEQVEMAILGGATFIQLREKNIGFDEYAEKGNRVKEVCQKYGVCFVINDNVNVAKAIDCDGVHVGQSDMELALARDILGDNKIIGVSANTIENAIKAEMGGADYIGVGAIFPTSTKADADTVGIDRLMEIRKAVNIPIVAIGGINGHNANLVAKTGADGIAVVSAMFGAENITEAAKELSKWKNSLKA